MLIGEDDRGRFFAFVGSLGPGSRNERSPELDRRPFPIWKDGLGPLLPPKPPESKSENPDAG